MKKEHKLGLLVALLMLLGVFVATPVRAQNDALVNFGVMITKVWDTLNCADLVATDDVTAAGDVQGSDLTSTDDTNVGDELLVSGLSRLTTVKVGSTGTTFSGILSTNVSVDIGSTATNVTSSVNVTLTGCTTNDVVTFNLVSPHTSFRYNAFISAADTITLYASNISITNNINPAASDARFTVIKY